MAALVVGVALAGCGKDENSPETVARQVDAMANSLTSALETETHPVDVVCVRPFPGRFECRAYVAFRSDIAGMATYIVRPGNPELGGGGLSDWRATATRGRTSQLPAALSVLAAA